MDSFFSFVMRSYRSYQKAGATWLVVCCPGIGTSTGDGFLMNYIRSSAVVDDFGDLVAVGGWE